MTHKRRKQGPGLRTRLALKLFELVAPGAFERRFARNFVTPRPNVARETMQQDLPTPSETMMVASGDDMVAAWRWGEGPAVLLVHGWEDDHHCFDSLISQLILRGHAVVAFDLPAHGKSGGRHTAFPSVVRAIRDVAEAMGPIRAIVGHSFGAAAATHAIADGFKVERAVALASPVSLGKGIDAMLQQFGLSAARRHGIDRELEKIVGAPPSAFDLEVLSGRLKSPALIMHSFNDRMVPFEAGARLARAWTDARFVAIDGLGHRRLLDDRSTIEQIAEFLEAPAERAKRAAA